MFKNLLLCYVVMLGTFITASFCALAMTNYRITAMATLLGVFAGQLVVMSITLILAYLHERPVSNTSNPN